MEAGRLDEIDGRAQQVAKIRLQSSQVEEVAAGVQIDEKVDIAVRVVFPPRDGTEYANVRCAMQFREGEDRGALFGLEDIEIHGRLYPLCLVRG